jgi:aspartate carbamoyltransferase catalytic subunit
METAGRRAAKMSLKGRDLITIDDLSNGEIEGIFNNADEMSENMSNQYGLCRGMVMASLFFEPSTRTRLSFETAMARLGGRVVGFAEPGGSSMAKGETLEDTIRMVDAYTDIIVMRHPKEGSASSAAQVADHPVINAGDGSQHHPTQAMLDLFTIWRELGKVDGLHVAVVGDLKHGRAATSLIYGLSKFDHVRLSLVSPSSLKIRSEVADYLSEKNISMSETENLTDVIRDADVVYVTRIQKERFSDPAEYERVKGSYCLDLRAISGTNDQMIILHPLPRVDELATEVDSSPHAKYFEQAKNGVPVRMALLALILGKAR